MSEAQCFLPYTADQLNDWLRKKFSYFEGPARAYFELPVHSVVAGVQFTVNRRVTYLTFGLEGSEYDCVRAMVDVFKSFADEDATEALFVRRTFRYEEMAREDDSAPRRYMLSGRFAFWNDNFNNLARASLPYKPEGTDPRSI